MAFRALIILCLVAYALSAAVEAPKKDEPKKDEPKKEEPKKEEKAKECQHAIDELHTCVEKKLTEQHDEFKAKTGKCFAE